MIYVTRLNKSQIILNCEWIETIEATPDSVITLSNGKKYVVSESVEEIIKRIIEYKQKAGFASKIPIVMDEESDDDK
jgi:flagellar protein FlbD